MGHPSAISCSASEAPTPHVPLDPMTRAIAKKMRESLQAFVHEVREQVERGLDNPNSFVTLLQAVDE